MLFQLKIPDFFPFLIAIFTVMDLDPLPNTDLDPGEPFVYGSTWIRFRNTGSNLYLASFA